MSIAQPQAGSDWHALRPAQAASNDRQTGYRATRIQHLDPWIHRVGTTTPQKTQVDSTDQSLARKYPNSAKSADSPIIHRIATPVL